jgi:glucose-1-phosphate cytidylyltransferase
MSDITFDMEKNSMEVLDRKAEPWRVTLVDTGDDTMTGGRLKRIMKYLNGDDAFCFTYGDGLSNVDICKSIGFHKKHGKLATVTAVLQPGRFGVLDREGDSVRGFTEKPIPSGGWINGGFFVLSPKVIEYISSDACSWEQDVMSQLAIEGELRAFEHTGFWQPMDTLREKNLLEKLWTLGNAPWKRW